MAQSLFLRLFCNNWMACKQFNGARIRADVLDTIQSEVSALAQQLDDAINECYNNKMYVRESYNANGKINSKRYPL